MRSIRRKSDVRSAPRLRLRLEQLEQRVMLNGFTVYVDDDFTDATPGWGVDHFDSIQDGINATGTDDTVMVAAGTYDENLTIGSSHDGLTLQGAGADVTIIDGGGDDTVIDLNNFDGGLITGFTIQNGSATQGGGINAGSSDSTISCCIITGNEGTLDGGGIYIEGGAPLIINDVFTDNTAFFGAAIYVNGGAAQIVNDTIYGNTATSCGGAMYSEAGVLVLANSILWNNTSFDLFPNDEIMLRTSAFLTIRYCIIMDGTDQIYAFLGGGFSYDSTNSESNPDFVNAGSGDFHLQSTSPAIDAAHGPRAPVTDFDGNPRVDDPLTPNTGYGTPDYADIGAFEFVAIVDNDPPTITSLGASPDPVTRPDNVTLTAVGVDDPDGTATVAAVQFYRDTNGNGTLQVGTDVLLGTDTSSAGGWTWTGPTTGWPTGSVTLLARARDNYSAYSDVVSTTVTVENSPPTIGSLTDGVSGGTATLTAHNVTDDDTVSQVEFYLDENDNGTFQDGIDTSLGYGVKNGSDWSLPVDVSGWADDTYTVFARAQDNDSAWSDAASAEVVVGMRYVGRISDPSSVAYVDVYAREDIPLGNFSVKFSGGGVSSVQLGGTSPMDGLGLLIHSAPGSQTPTSLKDGRKGAKGDVAFIVSDGAFKSIQFKGGNVVGYDLNGMTLGDFTFDTDIDGDGATDDATAIYAEGYVQKIQFQGGAEGDIWIGGIDPSKGLSLASLANKAGGYHGDLVTVGGVGKISLGGSFGSGMDIGGTVGSLQIKNGSLGGTIEVDGALGKVSVSYGSVTADITVNGIDPKKGYSVSALQTKGGGFSGSLTTAGGIGKVSLSAGDFSGSIDAQGNVSSLSIKGGSFRAGADVQATGLLGKFSTSYYETDNGGTEFGIFAGHFGSIGLGSLKLTEASLPFVDGDFHVELLP